MPNPTVQNLLDLASQHLQAGRLFEAEQLYRQILAQNPQHAGAIHYLGVIAHRGGRSDIAADLIRKALALDPNLPDAQNHLANALKDGGQLDGAIAAFRQAAALHPTSADVQNNLGNALRDKGQLDQAIAAYRKAIALEPNFALAHSNLGTSLWESGQLDQAIAACRRAIALQPNLALAHNNLGNALKDKGQLDEAIAAYRQAIALHPANADAHNNLGNALKDKDQLDGAIAAYQKAIALKPTFALAHSNLGTALWEKGQLEEAVAACRQAIALQPNLALAHNNLGNAFKDKGQLTEAIAAYRQAIALKPDYAVAHSNLILSLLYHPDYDAKAIAQELRRWNRQHAQPLEKFIPIPHAPRSTPHAPRLRIAYLSPDFRIHPVGQFLFPMLTHHDKNQFEVFAYSQARVSDAMTQRLRSHADAWCDIANLSDQQVADRIRHDRIDILVDLALHTGNNRLPVFARKPAPVQITFAGYPGSTGLTAIDYRLSDPYLDPPGMDESIYSEHTLRLPHSFWCYEPAEARQIPVNSLPALQTGVVTFGCLNNFCKINDGVLDLWAQVLKEVENSRLLLLAGEGSHRQRTLDRLHQNGIDLNRIEYVPRQGRQAYLERYHRIDIGLDTLPYNGHTTSLDSFWMGVPVITLIGQTVVSRAGWCQLSNLNLTELAATTPAEFVQIAVQLAGDLPRLKELRSTLRGRMEQSPLMDAAGFTKGIEAAYRHAWRHWCETSGTRKG